MWYFLAGMSLILRVKMDRRKEKERGKLRMEYSEQIKVKEQAMNSEA